MILAVTKLGLQVKHGISAHHQYARDVGEIMYGANYKNSGLFRFATSSHQFGRRLGSCLGSYLFACT